MDIGDIHLGDTDEEGATGIPQGELEASRAEETGEVPTDPSVVGASTSSQGTLGKHTKTEANLSARGKLLTESARRRSTAQLQPPMGVRIGDDDDTSTITTQPVERRRRDTPFGPETEQQFEMGISSPFFIYVSSKKMAEYLLKVLQKYADKIGTDRDRIKLFTSDTKYFKGWHSLFSRDPNSYSRFADVVIATSVIGAGFSIDVWFESFVAFLFNRILTHKEEQQFCARVRFDIEQMHPESRRDSLMFVDK